MHTSVRTCNTNKQTNMKKHTFTYVQIKYKMNELYVGLALISKTKTSNLHNNVDTQIQIVQANFIHSISFTLNSKYKKQRNTITGCCGVYLPTKICIQRWRVICAHHCTLNRYRVPCHSTHREKKRDTQFHLQPLCYSGGH